MPASLAELVVPPTHDIELGTLIAAMRAGGFPVSSWHSGSLPRTLTEGEATALADLGATIATIAQGGFLDYAPDDGWLDLLGTNLFDEARKEAVATAGTVTLSDPTGAGPYTITPGEFWVATTDKTVRYVAATGGTLPAGGTLAITVNAESAGAAWNVGPGAITEILTPLAGVSVSNPLVGATGTWITRQGADRESPAAYKARLRAKWGTLGSGSTAAAFYYQAASASAEVTRVTVREGLDGTVSVTVAGPSGAVSTTAKAAVVAAIEAKRPIGVRVTVYDPTVRTDEVAGNVLVATGVDMSLVLGSVRAAIDAVARATEIGGVAYRASLIAAAMGVSGVRNISLATPAGDLVLNAGEVWLPTYALTGSTS